MATLPTCLYSSDWDLISLHSAVEDCSSSTHSSDAECSSDSGIPLMVHPPGVDLPRHLSRTPPWPSSRQLTRILVESMLERLTICSRESNHLQYSTCWIQSSKVAIDRYQHPINRHVRTCAWLRLWSQSKFACDCNRCISWGWNDTFIRRTTSGWAGHEYTHISGNKQMQAAQMEASAPRRNSPALQLYCPLLLFCSHMLQ